MAEGAYKGGRKVYENGKELNTFLNDDSGVRFTPEALGESGGYRPIESDSSSYGRTVDEALGDKEPAQGAYEPEPEPQPREVNTGSEYDAEINQAAAEYGVDPVLAHAVAQAESQHGKSTSNVVCVVLSVFLVLSYLLSSFSLFGWSLRKCRIVFEYFQCFLYHIVVGIEVLVPSLFVKHIIDNSAVDISLE